MAYSDKVLDHNENPRNVGTLDKNDDRVGTGLVGAPACLAGETLIAVVDGRGLVPIRTLAEEGKDVAVYSFDQDGTVVVKTALSPRLTQKNAECVRVSLDDGGSFICTPDHLIPTRTLASPTWVAAKELLPGENLVVFPDKGGPPIKVTSVEFTDSRDVYCMTVPDTHNFAIVCDFGITPYVGLFVHNCGDVMRLQILVNEEGIIEDAKFKTFGCGSAIASSSLVTEWIKGKTLDEAKNIRNSDIVEELTLSPIKVHCSLMAEDAIEAAIADYRAKQAKKAAVK